MLKRILVGLGGTEYTVSAINQAVALAMAHDAEVTGVSIIDEGRLTYSGPVPIGGGHYAHELANDRLEKAKERGEWAEHEFTEACRAAGVRHQVLHEVGEPFTLLIDQARYHDLMIFGLRSLFEFDLVPDPHNALVRLVQAGVRPLLAVSKGFYPVKKVLIAYSGSMESAKAMKRFVQMRLWPEAKLRIVTFEHAAEKAEQLVRDAAEYCRAHGFEPEEAFVPDSARAHLLPYAEEWGADLTVVGNSAKNLLLRRIFGETALHAIQNASRPLFLAQ
ncbi:Universal stress protein family protein [Anatilimnocola aggregata]|uniref:Universal stress protein family protein n=1 Tax=Anatilimnocola aggregata TaxID=2528021 RepID=A0A517YGC0_9BACT|nr:universal stress protein [Anatilimnocola aggregata]QDU29273.1 Universal stress protein family protein [Anatilimnocola aggregata]